MIKCLLSSNFKAMGRHACSKTISEYEMVRYTFIR